MLQRTMRRLHKWIAIAVGVFLLSWTVSGVVLLLPMRLPAPAGQAAPAAQTAPVDFREATISPAEAINDLEQALGKRVQVDRIALGRIQDTTVYRITTSDDGVRLVDAASGELFEMTQSAAERLAREEFPTSAATVHIDWIDQHDVDYPYGSLPAYRIVFADTWGTVSSVSSTEGSVFRSDRWTRLRQRIVEWHSFQPLTAITRRERLTRLAMIGLGSVGTIVVLTGYYLALPRRRSGSNR
jgi:hypothetical protein